MSAFIIDGGAALAGNVPVYGSKNAALPLLAAGILTADEMVIENVPDLSDVRKMIGIMSSLGATIKQEEWRIHIQAQTVDQEKINATDVKALRGSVLLLGALLGRDRRALLPRPGGDIIGARPIDVHLDAFRQLGAIVQENDNVISLDGSHLRAGTVILQEFSVTATENVLLTAATLPGVTTIHIAASEPHVVALADLLQQMGATITGAGTHTIVVKGTQKLRGATHTNIQDMLEAGFFILLAAATHSRIRVEKVPVEHLALFFKKLDAIGIRYDIDDQTITVHPSHMASFKLQSMPYPGIATDLQAPFAVIATQASGTSLIHDPMYEGRLKHIAELQKMGADAVICDPHRVIITGPTNLSGQRIPSLDIRAGATLVMAGLVASGQTIIDQAEIIDRGYANLMERLHALGARIRRE